MWHNLLPRKNTRVSVYAVLVEPMTKKDISNVEDPFDAPTYNLPEKPVTIAERHPTVSSFWRGLELQLLLDMLFSRNSYLNTEYKIYGKVLKRIQDDNQVRVRIGSPSTGYGQESRNRAARQRIPNRIWTDEDGVEHVEVINKAPWTWESLL